MRVRRRTSQLSAGEGGAWCRARIAKSEITRCDYTFPRPCPALYYLESSE